MTTATWRDAWHEALYGPRGFYRRDEGPAGHFATSAQGIPGVAEILAQALVATANDINADVVVDFACGRGELLDMMTLFVAPAVDLVGVDVVPQPAGLSPRVTWVESPGGAAVPSFDWLAGRRALVVAHEWLDVVPCTIAEVDDDGRLREVLIEAPDGTNDVPADEARERLRDELRDDEQLNDGELSVAEAAWAARWWSASEPGERVEIGLSRDEAWANLVAAVAAHAAPGSVVLGIDYVVTSDDPPPSGTLTGFRDGGDCSPIPDGSCDLTAHVMLDSLDVDGATTQRERLLDLFGDEALQPVPIDLASSDPAAYLERLALRSAFATATSSNGLGAFAWFHRTLTDDADAPHAKPCDTSAPSS